MLEALLGNAGHWLATRSDSEVYGPIGMEFGVYRLRLVQLVRRSDELHLAAYASIPYGGDHEQLLKSPKFLGAFIRRVLKTHGFKGREVVTTMQADAVRMLLLHYTVPAGQTDAEAIIRRMSERVEGELSDYVLDYMPVRIDVREGQEHSALVALAQREEVIAYLELLRKAGLAVKALEIGPVAIRRLVTARQQDYAEDNMLVVTLGQTHTYMTVLSGRRLIFDREVQFGEKKLIERLCQELEMDESAAHRFLDSGGLWARSGGDVPDSSCNAEVAATVFDVLKPLFMELVSDINKALIYTASETRGKTVQQIYLTGAVARWKGVDGLLSDLINIPVSILDPMQYILNADDGSRDPRAGVVTGMALHGLVGDD